MKRTDNETRKRDVTDNEAGKQGLLKRSQVGPFGDPVESNPQVRSRAPLGARSGDAGLPRAS